MSPAHDPPTSDAPPALDLTDPLHCFACGHDYRYLGDGPHPGRCPRCDSRGVTPAGDLRLDGPPKRAIVGGNEGLRIDAVDDTGRDFVYWVSAIDDHRGQLIRVTIGDTGVSPGDDEWPDRLNEVTPEGLIDAAESAGTLLVAPASLIG